MLYVHNCLLVKIIIHDVEDYQIKQTLLCHIIKYMANWSGVPDKHRAKQGVAVILSNCMKQCMKVFKCITSRLIWVKMNVGLEHILLLCEYTPVNSAAIQEKISFGIK